MTFRISDGKDCSFSWFENDDIDDCINFNGETLELIAILIASVLIPFLWFRSTNYYCTISNIILFFTIVIITVTNPAAQSTWGARARENELAFSLLWNWELNF